MGLAKLTGQGRRSVLCEAYPETVIHSVQRCGALINAEAGVQGLGRSAE